MTVEVVERKPEDPCPECGGEVTFGFGMAGGGEQGGYEMCLDCDWFSKPKGGAMNCFPLGDHAPKE